MPRVINQDGVRICDIPQATDKAIHWRPANTPLIASALSRRNVNRPVKMSRFDQAASHVTATISAAVSASDAAKITNAMASAV